MIRTIAALIVGVTLAVAADKSTTPAATLPKGAVEVSPGTYRATDSSGKTWTYRKTPFGLMKTAGEPQEKPHASETDGRPVDGVSPFGDVKAKASEAAVADGSDITQVVEEGESLRFERKSPFGAYKWTRKKTELNAAERQAWERSQASRSDKGKN